ncbi:MAG: hypothetical protein ACI4MI_00965 [Christensenellales bacterium]
MDYSKFYLRNRTQEDIEDTTGEEFSPQIVYIDYPKVRSADVEYDYEVSPQQIDFDEDNKQEKGKKLRKKGRSFLNKTAIFLLTIIIVILSTFVISDFVVDGKLMTAFGQMIERNKVEKTYYIVGIASFDDYDQAKNQALELRKGGAAGNIVKENDKYMVVGNIFDDSAQANSVAIEYEQGCVRELNIYAWQVNDKELKNLLQQNAYFCDTIDTMIQLQAEYSQGETYLGVIRSELSKLKSNLAVQRAYFESKSQAYAEQKVVEDVLLDMQVCAALLGNIETNGQQQANVLCDIRYYAVQIAINARDLTLKYS